MNKLDKLYLNVVSHGPQAHYTSSSTIGSTPTGLRWPTTDNETTTRTEHNIFQVVSYMRGLSERVKKTCNTLGIELHFKMQQHLSHLIIGCKTQGYHFTKKWGNVLIQISSNRLCRRIYKGIRKDL